MKRLLLDLAFIAIFLITIGIVIATYWVVKPYKILEFHDGNGVLVNHVVKSGGYLEIQQNRCKKLNFVSHIDREFIDSIVYQVPLSINDRPVGCYTTPEFVYVPKALPLGRYTLRTTISFKPNPLQTVTYVLTTDEFEIVK